MKCSKVPILVILSAHFSEIQTFESNRTPILDFLTSNSQILNQIQKNSENLGILGGDLVSSGIFLTFQSITDFITILSNSTVNKLKFLKGRNWLNLDF